MRGPHRLLVAHLIFLAAIAPARATDPAATLTECKGTGFTPPGLAGSHAMPPDAYPLISVVQKEEGTVTLGFTIQQDGSITDIHMIKSSGFPRLDETSAETVKDWRYKPGQKDGKPTACPWKANVVWSLRNAPPVFPQNGPFGVVQLGPTDYPSDALRRKEAGAAAFAVGLAKDGKKMFSVMIHSTGYADLDGASADYVKNRLDLKPAELSGKPIASFVNIVLVWIPDAPQKSP